MFSRASVEGNNGTLEYLVAGDGKVVFYLSESPSKDIPAAIGRFSATRRVVVPAETVGAERIVGIIDGLGDGTCDVIAFGAAASTGLQLAALLPGKVDKLVLETPSLASQSDALQKLVAEPLFDNGARMLTVIGSQCSEEAHKTAIGLKSSFQRSHLAFVYEAGENVAETQPLRYGNLVSDFLQKGGAYVIKG